MLATVVLVLACAVVVVVMVMVTVVVVVVVVVVLPCRTPLTGFNVAKILPLLARLNMRFLFTATIVLFAAGMENGATLLLRD